MVYGTLAPGALSCEPDAHPDPHLQDKLLTRLALCGARSRVGVEERIMWCPRLHVILMSWWVCGAVAGAASADVVSLNAVRDATVYESNDGSLANGAGQYIFAGRTNQAPAGLLRRGLIQFDLAGVVPEGAEIVSARLVMNLSQLNGGAADVALHRCLTPWTSGASDPSGGEGSGAPAGVGDATWRHASWAAGGGGSFWNQPGGDFVSAASASVLTTSVGLHTWSSDGLLADVRMFAASPAINFGWFVIGPESSAGVTRRFDSADSAGAGGIVPRLEIEWTVVPAPGAAFTLLVGLAARRRRRA